MNNIKFPVKKQLNGGVIINKTAIPFLLYLFFSAASSAQWSVQPSHPEDATPERARVINNDGYQLSIKRDHEDTIIGELILKKGFDRFPNDGCPTIRIDSYAPIDLTRHARSCIAMGDRVIFILGNISHKTVESRVLSQIMIGNNVIIRFPLDKAGYRETHFNLHNSRQSLELLLGSDTRVIP